MIDKQRLEAKCSTWNITLTGTQLDQLDAFAEILVDYNQKVNLTAITDPEGIEDKHFLDSLLFAFKHECTPPSQFCRVCFPHFPGKAWKISGFSHSVPHKERPCQTNRSAGSFRIRSLLRYFSGLFAILPPFLG